MKPKSLIYCRVSSENQVKNGHGLDSQEKRCRDYAYTKGYDVAKVFFDEGVSGGLFDRPAMIDLLDYLDAHAHEQFVVVFDDLARFARDVEVHIKLKAAFTGRGVKLECLNFNFDESEESEYAELVLAAGNQYLRKQNRRQVIQKMKARLESGYWSFCNPPGLKFINDSTRGGKILVPNEPYATIYKQAIEGYAKGELPTLSETSAFILKMYKAHGISRKLSLSGTVNILKNILYAGYIEYPYWKVPLRKAQHEGFISYETYGKVQERLNERSKPRLRKDYNQDFPLRNFVACELCEKPLTGAWVKGRSKYYARYWCKHKGCLKKNKSISRDIMGADFELLLKKVKPPRETLSLAEKILTELWNKRIEINQESQVENKQELRGIDDKVNKLLSRISGTDDDMVVKAYEAEMKRLLDRKKEIECKDFSGSYSADDFKTALSTVFGHIEKPVTMWQSDDYEEKRTLLTMYFDDRIIYSVSEGFKTAGLTLPIALINSAETHKKDWVEMPGVEPGSAKAF